jgi:tryptophanyl-tRNA synthetase
LITGIVDFLSGYNGKKMNKSNDNCIFLDDTHEKIKSKIRKIPTNNRTLDDKQGNIVLEYSKAFYQTKNYENILQQHKSDNVKYEKTKEYLSDSMCKIAQKSQSNSNYLTDNELWEILLNNSNKLKVNTKLII